MEIFVKEFPLRLGLSTNFSLHANFACKFHFSPLSLSLALCDLNGNSSVGYKAESGNEMEGAGDRERAEVAK
jgi:hypothetical protein